MLTTVEQDDYRALIDYLNTRDAEERARKKHRLPLECYAASDCEFHFTLCARAHGRPFARPELAKAIIESLLWRRQHHHWMLYCYCLMPDHLHFLLRLAEEEMRRLNAGARGIVPETVLDHIGQLKSYTTTQMWWRQGGRGQLWQKSSYDRLMRYDNSVEAAALYVLQNPVRKGLVQDWQDYPYSGVVDLSL